MGGNISVIGSLYKKALEAHRAFPRVMGTEGLLALMDFQVAQLMATDIQVRRIGCEQAWSGNGAEALPQRTLDRCAAVVPSLWHPQRMKCPCARSVCLLSERCSKESGISME